MEDNTYVIENYKFKEMDSRISQTMYWSKEDIGVIFLRLTPEFNEDGRYPFSYSAKDLEMVRMKMDLYLTA